MGFSTNAHLFYGVNIEIPEGVEWDTLVDDTESGIKMIAYGSEGNSMYAVAIHASVATVELDAPSYAVMTESSIAWPMRVRAFCEKHGLTYTPAAWRMAVERF